MKKVLFGLFFCFLSLNAMRKRRKVSEGGDFREALLIINYKSEAPYIWIEHRALELVKRNRRYNFDILPTFLGEFSTGGS